MPAKKDVRLTKAGVSGYNKPKRTPKHPKKSHVVVAKEGNQIKTIRFGQQGKTGDKGNTARSRSFKARHAANIKKNNAKYGDCLTWNAILTRRIKFRCPPRPDWQPRVPGVAVLPDVLDGGHSPLGFPGHAW